MSLVLRLSVDRATADRALPARERPGAWGRFPCRRETQPVRQTGAGEIKESNSSVPLRETTSRDRPRSFPLWARIALSTASLKYGGDLAKAV